MVYLYDSKFFRTLGGFIMSVILPPFWHPACKKAFILDWDGVLADTKLDYLGKQISAKHYAKTMPDVHAGVNNCMSMD